MNLELMLLALPLLTAVTAFPAVAWAVTRRREPGRRAFAAFTAVVVTWSLAVLFSWTRTTDPQLELALRVALSAGALVPALALLAALRLVHRKVTAASVVLLPALGAAALVWTPAATPWVWRALVPVEVIGLTSLGVAPGIAFWVWWVGAGFALGIGSSLAFAVGAPRRGFRPPAGAGMLAFAPLPPMVVAAYALASLDAVAAVVLTPMGLGVSAVLLAWGLERRWAEQSGPIEYRDVFAGLGDGLVLVDEHGVVLDVNPAAERALGVSGQAALGRPLASIRRDFAVMGRESVELPPVGDGPVYEARSHPLPGSGRLLIIRDVTARRAAADALGRRAEVLAATEAAARAFLEEPDWTVAVDGMLARLGAACDASRVALLEFDDTGGTDEAEGPPGGGDAAAGVPSRGGSAGLLSVASGSRRWQDPDAPAWNDGYPPYGSRLLAWAASPPGFAGDLDEVPARDRDALQAIGVGYVALLPVSAVDGVLRVLAFEWTVPVPRWLPLVVDTLRAAPAALEAVVRRRHGELASERHRRYQASLLDVTRELLAQDVTPAFYQALLERAVGVIPGAQGGCVLVRGPDGAFALAAATGAEAGVLARVRFDERELSHGGAGRAGPRLVRGDALDAGVDGARSRAARETGAGPGPAVSLAVPVELNGRLEASLRLDNLDAEDGFPPEAIGMAEAFGLQVAALLQRLRLEERRDRAARMNALLADIERLLLVGGDLGDFFPVLARLALEVPGLDFDRMAVLRLDDDAVTIDAFDPAGAHDQDLETALVEAGWIGGARGPLAALRSDPRPRFREHDGDDEPVAAYAAQPLMLRGQPWGMIVFCAFEPRTFDGHVRDTLGQLANSIELALVRQRDAEQREWQLAKLEAVVSTSEALRGATRRRDVVVRALQAVLEMTRADVCDLYLIDPDADLLRRVGSRADGGRGAHEAGGAPVTHGEGDLLWQVIEAGRTVDARDAGGLAEVPVSPGAPQPVAYLGTPLRNGEGEIVGVVSALVRAGGRSFEREDAGFLEAIALACGNALDRLALVEQSRAQAAEYRSLFEAAKRQTAELTLLDRVRGAVASELDLQAVFAAAAAATVEVLGYRRVGLFAHAGGELVLQHQLGYDEPSARNALAGVAQVAARVADTGEPLLVGGGAGARAGDVRGASVDAPWQAAVPLVAGDGVVGVLVAEGRAAGSADEDLRLLRAVGEQLGVAAERGRLYGVVQQSEQRFRLLAEHMQDLVCLHDPQGRYVYVSPSASTVLGYAPEALVGVDPFTMVHEEDRERVRESGQQRLLDGEETVQVGYRFRHADGHYVWLETVAQPVRDARGEVVNIVTSSRDITERKRIEERLVQGALFDELTGLANRVLLLDRLRQALSRASRNESWRFALLFLDLDRFKVVNDSLGHNAGDELLKSLAARLKTCVRGSDTVARLGGDEFCVLIEDVDGPDHATATAARIQTALAEPFTLHGHDIFTSASIGIAFSAVHYRDPQELLRDADIAMYRAKASGKARFAIFDEGMHARALGQMQLETSLHRAPDRNELFLEYQPVYRLRERRLVGVEALVRWQHPERGLVAPTDFVPLAEESGQIVAIDRWVLGQATRQLAAWAGELGAGTPPPVVSVNVSARHLALQDVDTVLRTTLEEAGVPASSLKLEIGEGALMSYPEAAVEALTRLHILGVRVQVDDFGTGFSSLKHLQRLPIDSLKIDGSFVRGIDGDEANRDVVSTIVGLARSLGIDAVAEGIEREEELETLLALGCEFGQGYLFAPPLAPEEVARRLLAQRAL